MEQSVTTYEAARLASLGELRKIEFIFDRVFNAANNPWRHLGALSFFFFWIITASGIYLYVFFDTGVSGAYQSVEALSNGQRYAGGVMRSLHRHASDAFMLTVVLHLAKEFLRGRYGGFRWFSWITGVPLLWLLFASGIGGYWLPWDRLAQFVAIATVEWLDALPLFAEPLARNFLVVENVSDRLFTLLIFLHIGIPLALLLGMFIHIQRVNHADVHTGRVLGWGTLAALLVLALAKPALSQGPADLATVPHLLAFDWFYLFPYWLLYSRSAAELWVLAGAVTGLLMLLPLLARGARAPVARVDLENCNGCARCFADCPYAAVVMRPRSGAGPGRMRAEVIPALCASCGICAGACPSSTPFRSNERLVTGIDMPQLPVNELRAALERGLSRLRSERRIVAFGCDCAARIRALEAPDVAVFSLLCIGMLPPSFIEYALRSGAEGVMVAGCREGDCAYRLGNVWTARRLEGRREPHLRPNVASERVRLVWSGAGEGAELARKLDDFRLALEGMPRNAPHLTSRTKALHNKIPIERGS
ncbi:MAG: hydrogenase iron-sulfur subunit [Burkholderiales bacterium]|nr:hydrogenase iron-sulfur subunit [Burkholderiales bacterium]